MPLSDHGRVRKQQFHDRLGILHHRTLHRKLKERFPAAFNTRWTRQHWLHASLFLTLGCAYYYLQDSLMEPDIAAVFLFGFFFFAYTVYRSASRTMVVGNKRRRYRS